MKIIEINLPLVFLFLSGLEFTFTLGKGDGISQALEGFPYTFPSKTCLFCQTFSGRNAETFRGFLCEALDHMFEGTWFFFNILFSELFFSSIQCSWSSATRLIMQTLVTMFSPFLDPCRNRISVHMIYLGNGFDRYALAAQQKTMGTHTSSM